MELYERKHRGGTAQARAKRICEGGAGAGARGLITWVCALPARIGHYHMRAGGEDVLHRPCRGSDRAAVSASLSRSRPSGALSSQSCLPRERRWTAGCRMLDAAECWISRHHAHKQALRVEAALPSIIMLYSHGVER